MKLNLFLILLFFSFSVPARDLTVLDEAGQMGTFYSLAKMCGENKKKLDNFELIAGRIMANKVNTDEEEMNLVKEYTRQKLLTTQKRAQNILSECPEILARFRQMPLFQSVVYADGSIKMPDGSYLPATRPFYNNKK